MKTAGEELPKIKQLTLSDPEMDFVAACVLQATALLSGDLARATKASFTVFAIASKIGTARITEILAQFEKIC